MRRQALAVLARHPLRAADACQLGAGWVAAEGRPEPLPFVTLGRRLAAWREPSLTYPGVHFRLEEGRLEPKPDRPIPIWLGVYGPRGLDPVARKGDGWIPSMPDLPPPEAARRLRTIRERAERAGRDPDAITYAYDVRVRVGGGPAEDPGREMAGEPAEVVDRLAGLLGTGFSRLNLWLSGDRAEQRERVAGEVLPTSGPRRVTKKSVATRTRSPRPTTPSCSASSRTSSPPAGVTGPRSSAAPSPTAAAASCT